MNNSVDFPLFFFYLLVVDGHPVFPTLASRCLFEIEEEVERRNESSFYKKNSTHN